MEETRPAQATDHPLKECPVDRQGDQPFPVAYLGSVRLDPRASPAMLPWLLAEVSRRAEREAGVRQVVLHVGGKPHSFRCIPVGAPADLLFQHPSSLACGFVQGVREPASFAYMVRSCPDANPMCHVFQSSSRILVPGLIGQLRRASKAGPPVEPASQSAFSDSVRFEVRYRGRVTVASRKPQPSLIDDCLRHFRQASGQDGEEGGHSAAQVCTQQKASNGSGSETLISECRPPNNSVLNSSCHLGSHNPPAEGSGNAGSNEAHDTPSGPSISPKFSRSTSQPLFQSSPVTSRAKFTTQLSLSNLSETDSGFPETDESVCSEQLASPHQSKDIIHTSSMPPRLRVWPSAGGEVADKHRAVAFRQRSNSASARMMVRPLEAGDEPQRIRHASLPEVAQPEDEDINHTMLFQVGRFEIYLISPESKSTVMEKNFKEVASVSQGIDNPDHFGLMCRETSEQGSHRFMCYVFQCASEELVEEVMQTMRQGFQTAAALHAGISRLQLCEACPMHFLHRLCERINGLQPLKAKLIIQKHLALLSDGDQALVFEQLKKVKTVSDAEENEILMGVLRILCENKQRVHVHLQEGPQLPSQVPAPILRSNSQSSQSKLGFLRNRARKSITNSLENILNRGVMSRLGSGENFEVFKERRSSRTEDLHGASPPVSPTFLPRASTPTQDLHGGLQSPPPFRRRAHTISSPQAMAALRRGDLASETQTHRQASHAKVRQRGNAQTATTQSAVKPSLRPASWRKKIFLQVTSGNLQPSATFCENSSSILSGQEEGDSLTTFYHGHNPNCPDFDLSMEKAKGGEDESPREVLSKAEGSSKMDTDNLEAKPRGANEPEINEAGDSEQREQNDKMESEISGDVAVPPIYDEVIDCHEQVAAVWDRLLATPSISKIKCDVEKVQAILAQGVPQKCRGKVWCFLAEQHRLRHRISMQHRAPSTPYKQLLRQLTTQQHAIIIDLGRTFPNHPYFSAHLGSGQLSLYNILKAYSLLDPEVGYCQGLSFVAGVLLLHLPEELAFEQLKFLMFDLGLRRRYRPDMSALQVEMFQLSRLLFDHNGSLYLHLFNHEVGPCLYATPWFITLFASQFPLGFVSRIFDFVFLQGAEVTFKVAQGLVVRQQAEIMQQDSFESITDFLKNSLPLLDTDHLKWVLAQISETDISRKLQAYEVEFRVLCEELPTNSRHTKAVGSEGLAAAYENLCRKHIELISDLQVMRSRVYHLEQELFRLEESNVLLEKNTCEVQKHRGPEEVLPTEGVNHVLNEGDEDEKDEQAVEGVS
uniref:TBC1 domain family member 4-like isoform X2 n=1 Tax=Myxine glutinosa TaxID=7769 RepID=UPI00358FBFA1